MASLVVIVHEGSHCNLLESQLRQHSMLSDKFLKAFPVRDFMLIPLLEMGHGLIVPGLGFAFEPQV